MNVVRSALRPGRLYPQVYWVLSSICCLFNNTFSSSVWIPWNYWMFDELNKMHCLIRRPVLWFVWRDCVIRIQNQDSQSADRDLKPGPPEYKTGVLWKKCSVVLRYVDWCIFTDVSKRPCTEHLSQAVTWHDGPEDLCDHPHRSEKPHCRHPRLPMVMFNSSVFVDPTFIFSVPPSGTIFFPLWRCTQRGPSRSHSFTQRRNTVGRTPV
jgi:hypothetical protein